MNETDTAPPGFEETYREHRLPLVRLTFLMCGSRDFSEDIVQTVFASAHPRWHEIDNHLAYLRRAAVNLAKDGQRRHFRRLRLAPPPDTAPVTSIPEVDETWALIQRLPSAQRSVVVLHYYEDLTLVEVANLLNRPASTVRSDLRRALRAVAATVEDEHPAARKNRRRRRRAIGALGAVAVAVPLAAAAIINIGPEYVDKIPPDNVIVAGSVEGHRYWMFESSRTDECDNPEPGADVLVEDRNIIGQEWNIHGMTYGEPRRHGCGYDVSGSLADPSLSYLGGTFVGDTFVRLMAVHPDVTAIRVTIDGSNQMVEVHPLNGAGYAIFEVPPDSTRYTVELLIGDRVVPGSIETRAVPVP